MSRGWLVLSVLAALTCVSGCRCFPGFPHYADLMDDVGDDEWAFDQWYKPRLDISRAGKPDWCGPVNRRLAPCRCCNQPEWGWADDCWRYPGQHPNAYPSQLIPPAGEVMVSAPAKMAPAEIPPPPGIPITPVVEPQTPAITPPPPVPNPFEDPPPPAKPAPALQAPPLPDPAAARATPIIVTPQIVVMPQIFPQIVPGPASIADPLFEAPLQVAE
jgi:hypothetical protein